MKSEKRWYLDDMLQGEFFDTQDLNLDKWQQDNENSWFGEWYTTDQDEAEWFYKLVTAYKLLSDGTVDTSHFNEYDDYVDYANSLLTAI